MAFLFDCVVTNLGLAERFINKDLTNPGLTGKFDYIDLTNPGLTGKFMIIDLTNPGLTGEIYIQRQWINMVTQNDKNNQINLTGYDQ